MFLVDLPFRTSLAAEEDFLFANLDFWRCTHAAKRLARYGANSLRSDFQLIVF
jgi:hypothetical protein